MYCGPNMVPSRKGEKAREARAKKARGSVIQERGELGREGPCGVLLATYRISLHFYCKVTD